MAISEGAANGLGKILRIFSAFCPLFERIRVLKIGNEFQLLRLSHMLQLNLRTGLQLRKGSPIESGLMKIAGRVITIGADTDRSPQKPEHPHTDPTGPRGIPSKTDEDV